jgi:hypothetical protein
MFFCITEKIILGIFKKKAVNSKVFEIHTFSFRSHLISKKSIIWFILIPPAKFQPPNPSIKATNGIPRFWSFGRFVWKTKKLPNFFIFDFFFTFLFWISLFGYLKVRHVEFSANLSLVWMKNEFLEISSAILYEKITRSRISRNAA